MRRRVYDITLDEWIEVEEPVLAPVPSLPEPHAEDESVDACRCAECIRKRWKENTPQRDVSDV